MSNESLKRAIQSMKNINPMIESIEIDEESEDEKLIREIHEEPESTEVLVKMKISILKPLDYIRLDFKLEET